MNKQVEKIYVRRNDTLGFPQEFKGIKFYPIKIGDVEGLNLFYRIFSHPKNYIPEKKIIKLSYLKFLLFAVQASLDPKGKEIEDGLKRLLAMVTKNAEQDISIIVTFMDNQVTEETYFSKMVITILINGTSFSEQDFDIIREIILEQSGLSYAYIEDYDPTLEELLQYENDKFDLTFDDEIFIYCCLSKSSIKEVSDLSLYQFKKLFEREILLHAYDLYSPLEVSGQIKSKNGKEIVKHYLSKIGESSRYGSILVDKKEFLDNVEVADENGKIHAKPSIRG